MEQVLAYLSAIHPLSPALQEHLVNNLKYRHLLKKEHLLKAGHICRQICFIEEGLLRCYYIKEDHEVCSWFMKEGDVIISVESFYKQQESYESIQALEACTLWYIDYKQLQQLYRQFPELNFIGRVLTEKYYALSEQRLYALRQQRGQDRYDYLLQHHPELLLRVPAKYIASYLGITETHFSYIKAHKMIS